MNRFLCLVFLFAVVAVSAQPDTTLAIGKCAACDTLYKKDTFMPDGSPMIRKVTCYYADDRGNRSDELYAIVRFRNGVKQGLEEGFYRTQETVYVNWLQKPVKPSRFSTFLSATGIWIAPYSNRYSGRWKKGLKKGTWVYYDSLQRMVRDTFYVQGRPDPAVYDGGMSNDVDTAIDGYGQTLKSENGDTLLLWNVENNRLEGDFLVFGKHHRISEQHTFRNGRLLSTNTFRKGELRKELFYDKYGTVSEIFRYDKTGTPDKHLLLEPTYSYRLPKYVNAGIP